MCAAGQPFRMSTRTLLNSLVTQRQPGTESITGLCTVIYYLDLVGGFLITVILNKTFDIGLEHRGMWIGAPFSCAAIMWLINFILVCASQYVGIIEEIESEEDMTSEHASVVDQQNEDT
jgi:hypothetical protein